MAKRGADLFDKLSDKAAEGYTAKDIEVLEGLEPVRRRPGMYIGGNGRTRPAPSGWPRCIDNAMDEVVANHATRVEFELGSRQLRVTIRDNGRGIPVDPHPKFKHKSALEVILTTLHSGGKFSRQGLCQTSGGLHGVGHIGGQCAGRRPDESRWRAIGKPLGRQSYSGAANADRQAGPTSGPIHNRRGTTVTLPSRIRRPSSADGRQRSAGLDALSDGEGSKAYL